MKNVFDLIIKDTRPARSEFANPMPEPRKLLLIHDCLKKKTAPYRAMIDASIEGFFQTDSILDKASRHVLCADAKRIRSALALIATEAAGGDAAQAVPLAVGFELLHTASLIHDDIMDDAISRRGRPCAHQIFGTDIAITAGDALIFEAYRQLHSLSSFWEKKRVEEVLRIFTNCALETCRGQAKDLRFDNQAASVTEYIEMIQEKTGSMIEAPMESGAVLANADTECRTRFREYGRALGTAFQIIDDAIDYLGTEDKARKTLGNDLRRKKASAMMIYCREKSSPTEQEVISKAIDRFQQSGNIEDTKPVLQLMIQYDAIGFSQRLCEYSVNGARLAIMGIGEEPARTTLDEIAQIVGYWGLQAANVPE